MGSLARPLLTALAVLPLIAGPAAWAWECGCETTCDVAVDAAASACECCADCSSGCCGTPGERAPNACSADPGAGCECGCVVEAPLPPAVPAVQLQVAPPATVPVRFDPAANATGPSINLEEPDPAAGPPVRVRLCVWRN